MQYLFLSTFLHSRHLLSKPKNNPAHHPILSSTIIGNILQVYHTYDDIVAKYIWYEFENWNVLWYTPFINHADLKLVYCFQWNELKLCLPSIKHHHHMYVTENILEEYCCFFFLAYLAELNNFRVFLLSV